MCVCSPFITVSLLLPHVCLTDELVMQIEKLSFVEQVKVFATAGVVIIAHGAGQTLQGSSAATLWSRVALVLRCSSNALPRSSFPLPTAFMPNHAVVIEIFPYGIFCPMYTKLSNAAGQTVISIWSKQKSSELRTRLSTPHLANSPSSPLLYCSSSYHPTFRSRQIYLSPLCTVRHLRGPLL